MEGEIRVQGRGAEWDLWEWAEKAVEAAGVVESKEAVAEVAVEDKAAVVVHAGANKQMNETASALVC